MKIGFSMPLKNATRRKGMKSWKKNINKEKFENRSARKWLKRKCENFVNGFMNEFVVASWMCMFERLIHMYVCMHIYFYMWMDVYPTNFVKLESLPWSLSNQGHAKRV